VCAFVSELEIEELINKRTAEFLGAFLRRVRLSLLNYIEGWRNNMKYHYGIGLVVEVATEPSPDEIVVHVRAYIPPEEVERLRKSIAEEVRKSMADTKMRIGILKDLILYKLRSSTGEVSALLQAVHKHSTESAPEARGDREKGHHEEGGPGSEGDSQAA